MEDARILLVEDERKIADRLPFFIQDRHTDRIDLVISLYFVKNRQNDQDEEGRSVCHRLRQFFFLP